MIPISKRKKKVPLPKQEIPGAYLKVVEFTTPPPPPKQEPEDLPPHHLRKRELSELYGIPEIDIFVDPKNGVELYRTATGGWVYDPKYRGVESCSI